MISSKFTFDVTVAKVSWSRLSDYRVHEMPPDMYKYNQLSRTFCMKLLRS